MNKEELKHLLDRYLADQCTSEEKAYVETWYNKQDGDTPLNISEKEIKQDLQGIQRRLFPSAVQLSIMPLRRYAAVLILLILSGGLLYLYIDQPKQGEEQKAESTLSQKNDITPGGNKATLTLSDGTDIRLDEIAYGEIAEQAGKVIYKNKDGLIVYKDNGEKTTNVRPGRTNTISTPRGGQYNVTLPDGTNVWLNAASSLTYETVDSGKERIVVLKGEGYFEVAKDPNRPFKVVTDKQTVEVLGTHFNINSYADERSTKTTLVEGSVRIVEKGTQRSVKLKPGQQASLGKDHVLNISEVNVNNAIAWKSGLFRFENADIESIMRQLSRWYDVEVEFEGKKPDFKLWGEVHRNVNATQALGILTYFNLKYRIENQNSVKKIIITNR